MELWSQPCHTTICYLKQSVSLFFNTSIAMAETLHFDNKYWEDIFGTKKPKLTIEQRLQLIFSLLIFLQVSIARFLSFIFTCKIEAVRNRTSRFMGYTPTASTLDEQFAPRAILRAWYDEFPKVREHLNDIIKPWAYQIVQDESDQLITAVPEVSVVSSGPANHLAYMKVLIVIQVASGLRQEKDCPVV